MNEKMTKRAMEVATPLLQSGERAVLASFAAVHRESAKATAARQAATMVGSVVLTGGMGGAFLAARRFYLVLTDRRLLFFEETSARGRPRRELAAELPRADLRAKPARSLLYKTYHVTTVDGSPVLRLSFPLPTRGDADLLARELGSVTS